MIQLGDICTKASSGIAQKDLEHCNGAYPIYGASGLIKYVDFYQQENPYVAVVKDGAGVGRVMQLPAKSSVIGTMQYIIPNEGISVQYLAYAMEHMNLAKYYTGATIPHIYFKDYCTEKLQKHSESEQYRIAAVLGKLTALISLRKQQLAKLDELVKARFVEMFGDPEYNNRNLPIYKLSDLCEVGSSKRIYQNEQSSDGVPFLRVSDLVNRIDKGIESCELFIPSEKYKELCSQKLVPYQGDILVTSRGTLGKCYIVKDTDKFYFQDGMISWLSNFDKRITSVYISSLFSMSGFQKQITSLQSGSTIAYLSISMLKKLNIMLPTLQSQQQFVDFVEQVNLFGLTIQQSLDKLEVLRKSLMQEYFG